MSYRLYYSTDNKIIGNCDSQTEQAEYPVPINHPNLSRQYLFKKAPKPEKVITPIPILVKKAILTDLIGGVAGGNSIQLKISNKLKEILEVQNPNGMQFFPMLVRYKNIDLKNYWLTNPFYFDYNYIDFSKSKVYLYDIEDYTFQQHLDILNNDDFIKKISEVQPPKMVKVEKLHLKSGPKNLLILRWVYGGVGYYVSESLKQKIEDAGCSGIDFEPVEQA